jgi:hypothetical protein
MLWRREGDPEATKVLRHWVGFRGRLLGRALRTGRAGAVYEESLMLLGTARGIVASRRLTR